MRRCLLTILACLGCFAASPCAASPESTAAMRDPRPNLVLFTASRVNANVLELGYGRALGERFSALGLVNAGADDDGAGNVFHSWGAGLQGAWHVLGTMVRGLHVGVEARYEKRDLEVTPSVFGTPTGSPNLFSTSNGLQLGLLTGVRWSFRAGLVVQAQVGARWLATRTVIDCCNTSYVENASDVRPLGNFAIGWAW